MARRSPAPSRPRAEYPQRFPASRRFAFKDLNEGSIAARAAVPATRSVPPRRLSRANARLRRAMVRTTDMFIPSPFIRFDAKQWNNRPIPGRGIMSEEACPTVEWRRIYGCLLKRRLLRRLEPVRMPRLAKIKRYCKLQRRVQFAIPTRSVLYVVLAFDSVTRCHPFFFRVSL